MTTPRMAVASILVALAAGAVAACGGSSPSGGGPATAAPLDVASCPSASVVGAALGATLPAPTNLSSVVADLPSGATGVGCRYLSATELVIVDLVNNLPFSYLSIQETKLAAALAVSGIQFTPISGVGDHAVSYSYTTPTLHEPAFGVIAWKGTDHVGAYAAGPSASLSQVESLVNQLLS